MTNLGICFHKCEFCPKTDVARSDFSLGIVWCGDAGVVLTWQSSTPEKCPYLAEHVVTEDFVADFGGPPEDIEGSKP